MSDICPVVDTKLGRVKGRVLQKQSVGKQVYNYTNLPFAKPPVGDLRFEPPCKPEPWTGIRDGGKCPPNPPQMQNFGKVFEKYFLCNIDLDATMEDIDEDCLYLSVFTTNPSKSANLPVLFWIYGGGFIMGSQSPYNAHLLSGLHDVVVVIPNYRVGLLGFFTLGKDTDYPGNMGLFDQAMALEWTKEHIREFGGNPDNVTIFGESAGSMSVCYHMISPLSRGLFHRAIAHSGSAILGEGFPKEDNSPALSAFLEGLNIKDEEIDSIVAKMKSLTVKEINRVEEDNVKKMIYFTPSIDGKFIPDSPQKLLQEGKMAPVPFIVGCNSTEYFGILTVDDPVGFADGLSEESCSATLKQYLVTMMGLSDSAVELMKKQYASEVSDNDKHKWSKVFGNILGDQTFVLPAIQTANYHAESNHPTYLYHMTQSLRCFHDLEYGEQQMMKVPFCECDHGDDLYFTFGMPLDEGKLSQNVKFSDDEKQLTKEWMTYLINFARTGNPNTGSPVSVKWPSYSVDEQTFLSVQQPCSTKKRLIADRFQFWKEVIEPLSKK